MNKQIFKLKSLMGLALIIMSLIDLTTELSGQPLTLNADGTPHTIQASTEDNLDEGTPQDYIIPNTTFTGIHFTLKGGDGGFAKHGSKQSYGGQGATTTAAFKIGFAPYDLRPGGIIRFIVGKHGRDWDGGGSIPATGCGGGGTAILYRPSNLHDWTILAVAGAGAGAYRDSYHNHEGQGGVATEFGADGWGKKGHSGGHEGNGGGGGGAGGSGMDAGYVGAGGGGAYSDGGASYFDGDDPSQGGGKGYPDGGIGGGRSKDTGHTGGWGFGGGGNEGEEGGGGGGGYSGGGGGGSYQSGGGGGSYVNSVYAYIESKADGFTGGGRSQHGQVSYYFLNTGYLPQIHKPIKFAYNTNKCIDDYQSKTSNGTNIQTFNCTGNPNQNWYFHPTDRTIRSNLSHDKCLDLSAGNTSNGANIQLWDCQGGNANQFWVYNGLYKTIHSGVNSDKCGDAVNGSASTSNVNLQLWDCIYSNNNQKWVIDGATTVNNPLSARYIIPVLAPNFAVHSHTGAESGSNIQLWTKDQTLYAEYWYFDGLAIKMREYRDLCIDLSQSNTSNGNNIQLYNCNGTNAQKWIYDGMTQTIRSVVNPDKCMQIEKNTDGVYGKRSNVNIYDCNGSDEQLFLIQE